METFLARIVFSPRFYGMFRPAVEHEMKLSHDIMEYRIPEISKHIVMQQASRYHEILRRRTENAEYMLEELEGIVDFMTPVKGTTPSWLYFVFLHNERDKLAKRLLHAGVDIRPAYTFIDLSKRRHRKSVIAEKRHLVFALYRPLNEVEAAVKRIKRVIKTM